MQTFAFGSGFAVQGYWLDWMILRVFANLNDSMIVGSWCFDIVNYLINECWL